MSQADSQIGASKTGLQYRSDDNNGKKALLNHHKGSTAPTYAESGMVWVDDTATPWLMKTYDGTDWIIIGEINATTNIFNPYVSGAVLGDASETAKGLVERATDAEVVTGTDTTRYITPKQLADNAGGGHVVNSWVLEDSTTATITTQFPSDNTIPQITEGVEVMSLTGINMSVSTNKLRITSIHQMGCANIWTAAGIFESGSTDALKVAYSMTYYSASPIVLQTEYLPATTATQTVSLRLGHLQAATGYYNADFYNSTGKMGGTKSILLVEEIKV